MKDIKIELNTSNAQGEAYWRKRCDVVEVEIERLRAENERMREALISGVELQQKHYGNATNTHLYLSTWAETLASPALGPVSEQKPETCVWTYEAAWVSGCGLQYINAVIDADMKFCPFCGKRVEVKE